MKKEYDLKKLKRIKNGPITNPGSRVVKTIRLDFDVVKWLVQEAERRGLKYQSLINSILREAMVGGGVVLTAEQVREIVRSELRKRIS